MSKEWAKMTPAERREDLVNRWLNPEGAEYVSPEAEKEYKARVTRFLDAINLREPDRIPVYPVYGFFPAYYCGYTPYDAMYDYDKLFEAWEKCHLETLPDAHGGAVVSPPGKMFEILDYKLYAWPGHGVAKEHSYQCIEKEYMAPNEYDLLIHDPSYYFSNYYLPRIFGALDGLRNLPHLTDITEMYGGFSSINIMQYGTPPVQEAYKKLFEAGEEALKWVVSVGKFAGSMTANGIPGFFGGGTKVPFDTIGDTLRGSKGIMIDMYRQPNKLLEACEALTPIMVKMGSDAAKANGNPLVFIPLHKGADGFLSDEQFKKFYWPNFRALLVGLIEEGCIPFPWAEGGYNTRLEVIGDIPKGSVIYGFDQTDMKKAKEILGGVACVGGNMNIGTLSVGTKQQVEDSVKKLIDDCGKDGGYIMMSGAVIDDINPENVKTFINTTKEYGRYR
ncbi:MAG: hypothetical protein JW712_01715 [Dehalococcoidales bacterium]|nr:hypothetical protein [Dehalococcoidales bacterium]